MDAMQISTQRSMTTYDPNESDDQFCLPANAPQSDIVFGKKLNFKQMAYAIHEKYIREGSDWEINVSYRVRRSMAALFESEDVWMKNAPFDDAAMLYRLFNRCVVEMTSLIRSAFSRFKQTDSFMILQNKSKSLKSVSFEAHIPALGSIESVMEEDVKETEMHRDEDEAPDEALDINLTAMASKSDSVDE
uniref:Uncharacterized protein n=1 Tax=Elphidium margaritaceum TaxID=933848 RepID=A0A7S0TBH7_9EUKA|mmetsp:Transcript_1286/g.2532  ORF Transcript_1286/g.2532 Transcript_1286/m.2532 type:complete len:190 (+) Transcript_1286:3-572(+)